MGTTGIDHNIFRQEQVRLLGFKIQEKTNPGAGTYIGRILPQAHRPGYLLPQKKMEYCALSRCIFGTVRYKKEIRKFKEEKYSK